MMMGAQAEKHGACMCSGNTCLLSQQSELSNALLLFTSQKKQAMFVNAKGVIYMFKGGLSCLLR